jgi:hypothetical protein
MSEYGQHQEPGPNESYLPLSDTTIDAFSPDTNTLHNTAAGRRAKLERNPHLVDALDQLIGGWQLEDDVTEYFEDGFTLSHALVLYEADVSNTPPPIVSPDTIKSFMVGLHIGWKHGAAYMKDRYCEFQDHNDTYLDALIVDTLNGRQLSAYQLGTFMLGGFNAHDLLWQQRFVDSVTENYKRNAIEPYMPSA